VVRVGFGEGVVWWFVFVFVLSVGVGGQGCEGAGLFMWVSVGFLYIVVGSVVENCFVVVVLAGV